MKRMLRIVARVLTALSAIALFVAVWLWLATRDGGAWVGNGIDRNRLSDDPTYSWQTWSGGGQFTFAVSRETLTNRLPGAPAPPTPLAYDSLDVFIHYSDAPGKDSDLAAILRETWHGFAFRTESDGRPWKHLGGTWNYAQFSCAAPSWALAGVLAVAPAIGLFRYARRRLPGPPSAVRRSPVRRFIGILKSALVATSLALFVLTATVWVWARWRSGHVSLSTQHNATVEFDEALRSQQASLAILSASAYRDRFVIHVVRPSNGLPRPWKADGQSILLSRGNPVDAQVPNTTNPPATPRAKFLGLELYWFTRGGVGLMSGTRTPEDMIDGQIGPPRPIPWVKLSGFVAMVPYWMPLILTAIAPAVWARGYTRRRRAARRASANQCAACSYDLRASPERCPECGRATSESTSPA